MDLGPRRAAPAAGLLRTSAALVLLAACSASPAQTPRADDPDRGSPVVRVQGASDPGADPHVPLRSRVTRVAGHLSDVRRDRVARQARATVQDYLDGAFTASGRGPFRLFEAGLRRAARADQEVLTRAGGPTGRAGGRETTVTGAAAWFSVAAPGGRPVGITARLRVDLSAGSLTGRLMLTPADGRWQVFGYDLARGGR